MSDNLGEIVENSLKNVQNFFADLKSIFLEIENYLLSMGYRTTTNKKIIYENSNSLDNPEKWCPPYLSRFYQNSSNNSYLTVSVCLRYEEQVTSPLFLLVGKILGVSDEKFLKEVNIASVYWDWTRTSKSIDGKELIFVECIDNEIGEYGFERGYIDKIPLFQISQPAKTIQETLTIFDQIH